MDRFDDVDSLHKPTEKPENQLAISPPAAAASGQPTAIIVVNGYTFQRHH